MTWLLVAAAITAGLAVNGAFTVARWRKCRGHRHASRARTH